MPKTFAQYLIDETLPAGMHITKQVDKKYLEQILTEIGRNHSADYDRCVSDLKRLADRMSTYEPITMGMDEISVPNKAKRDAIIKKYTKLIDEDKKKGNDDVLTTHLVELQTQLAENDLDGTTDDASVMVRSAMGNKKGQLMKLRTSPGVVKDHADNIVPVVFPKSYAEGVDPVQFWLGATESRKNVAEGQINTGKPGEMSKIVASVLSSAVVSSEDCGTKAGILLNVTDDDIVGRYLAADVGSVQRNTLIDSDVQQKLIKSGRRQVLVRSPQTCEAPGGSICQKCMGIRSSTGKPFNVGDNAGLVFQGDMGEPLNQMSLSSKHSTTLATKDTSLKGEAGFRQVTEMPTNYKNRKVLCEVMGVIYRIRMAPQGGRLITIRQTRPVPDRYIVHAMPTPNLKLHWDYHIPPNLKLAEGIEEGAEVWPGMPLSTGVDNMQDVARLRNLGFMRSTAAQTLYDVFKNSGQKVERRHFELLARNANPYVQIIRCPNNQYFSQGETVAYQDLLRAVSQMPKQETQLSQALGKVLAAPALDLTVGTEIDGQALKYLQSNGVKSVQTVSGLEVAGVAMTMSRVVQKSGDWLSSLGHRNLKTQIMNAAASGEKSNIHGYNPVAAYAYGTEFGQAAGGKY